MTNSKRNWTITTLHIAVLLLAIVLETIMVYRSGYSNSYYAAAVKSMMQSWHNFFFVSYDPGGFIAVDKPPLALWAQTVSALIFGFRGWALLLPQLLAQVLAVELLYRLVAKITGKTAGLLAATFLALTPISVVLGGTNETDPILILFLLLSGWGLFKSLERRSLPYLLLSALFIGLAFNTKMLQAFIILPAFGLTYLFGSHISWKKRFGHLSVASLLILATSFSWILVVDAIPANQRPYVGSTQNNSEFSLATGYNGLQRILGQTTGFMLGANNRPSTTSTPQAPNLNTNDGNFNTPQPGNMPGGPPGGDGGGNTSFGGTTGVFRLWGNALGGQIGWYLSFALLGLVSIFLKEKIHLPLSKNQSAGLFWGLWLIAGGIVFSISQFMHPYYTATIAPPIAALVGIGLVFMINYYREGTWKKWLLPLSLLLGAGGQWVILSQYPNYNILKLIIASILIVIALILVTDLLLKRSNKPYVYGTLAVGLVALLVAPCVWIEYSLANQVNTTIPSAGPNSEFGGGPGNSHFAFNPNRRGSKQVDFTFSPPPNGQNGYPPQFGNNPNGRNDGNQPPPGGSLFGTTTADANLINFLKTNRGNSKFIVATESSHTADALIINTGLPVMAMGGFSGTDPTISLEGLKQYIKEGKVEYFLLSYSGHSGGNNSQISQWVTTSCKTITYSDTKQTQEQLYDCSGVIN